MYFANVIEFQSEHRKMDGLADAELRELSLDYRALALVQAKALAPLAQQRGQLPRWRWLADRRLARRQSLIRAQVCDAVEMIRAIETLRAGSSLLTVKPPDIDADALASALDRALTPSIKTWGR